MFSFVFLSSLVFSTFGTVCVWNRYGDKLNTYLNGNYELSSETFNSNPVYVRNNAESDGSCGASVTYMFYSKDKWRIKKELSDSALSVAKCDKDQKSDTNPWDCTEWYMPYSVDSEVTITNDKCPVAICDKMKFTLEDSPCTDLIFSKSGENEYVNSENRYNKDLYLYFNQEAFRWICGDYVDPDGCISGYGWTEETTPNQNPWISFSDNNLEVTQVWNKGKTATFECNPKETTTTKSAVIVNPEGGDLSSVCFWNKWTSGNRYLNGEYFYDGVLNGHNVYKSTGTYNCDTLYTLYLVYSDYKKWFIVDKKVSSGSYRAICDDSNLANPFDCKKWKAPSTIDSDIEVLDGNCPAVPCDTIDFTLSDTSKPCSGLTFTKRDSLTYYNSGKKYYLHFSPDYYRWVCDNDDDKTCLSAYSWSDTTSNSWINFDNSKSSTVKLKWKDNLEATFKCNINSSSDSSVSYITIWLLFSLLISFFVISAILSVILLRPKCNKCNVCSKSSSYGVVVNYNDSEDSISKSEKVELTN